MGTYLKISLINKANKEVKKFNKLWQIFSQEDDEKEYPQNFYDSKGGYTLNFYTEKDLESWAEIAIKNGSLKHIKINKKTSVKKAKEIIATSFRSWTEIGSCEIKLSGEHYCWHTLQRVKDFIDIYRNVLKVSGYDDLVRFIGYKDRILQADIVVYVKS